MKIAVRHASYLCAACFGLLPLGCRSSSSMPKVTEEAIEAPVPLSFDASRALRKLDEMASKAPVEAQALRRDLDEILIRRGELRRWVIPVFLKYLPVGADFRGRVFFDLGLKLPISESDGTILVDLAAEEWRGRPDLLWSQVLGRVYRRALTQCLNERKVAQVGPADPLHEVDLILEQVMVEGMVEYVASLGQPQGVQSEDIRIGGVRSELTDRFGLLQQLTESARIAKGSGLSTEADGEAEKRLAKEAKALRAYSVVGFTMARTIARESGSEHLMTAIEQGPRAFYAAYQKTGPGSLLNFRLPVAPEGDSEQPAAHSTQKF